MKRTILLSAALVVMLAGCGDTKTEEAPVETVQEETAEAVENSAEETNLEETAEESGEATEEASEEDADNSELAEELKDKYGVLSPTGFVRGDNTGKWKMALASGTVPTTDYAVEYAKAYMTEGDIHYICNLVLKTTTELQLSFGILQTKTTEYVDKEEHDASIIGGGLLLSENYFDMETGEEKTADADPNAGTVEDSELISAVKEAVADQVGEGEMITDVTFDGSNLTVFVDMSGAQTRDSYTVKDLAENRISSITDSILDLDDSYYNTWQTVTVDFGTEGKATLDKSMVVDQGLGRFFDFPSGILE